MKRQGQGCFNTLLIIIFFLLLMLIYSVAGCNENSLALSPYQGEGWGGVSFCDSVTQANTRNIALTQSLANKHCRSIRVCVFTCDKQTGQITGYAMMLIEPNINCNNIHD